ncbi:MAG: LEA type 2 family protein [Gammaproteobacteria bacterium]|nr:LEA type 2 family protein [Gammaproteobacteria bacterium]
MFRAVSSLLCIILLLVGCSGPLSKPLIEPKVQVRGLEITDATLGGIDAIVTLDIDNPNDTSLSARGLSYELFVSGNKLVTGQDDNSISVPAFGRETIALPVRLSYLGIIEALPEVLRTGNADYNVKGNIKTSIFNYPIPFSKQGDFKLPFVSPFK